MSYISATTVTHNEAADVVRAIRSLGGADELLVVDSGSTDSTCEVAAGKAMSKANVSDLIMIFDTPWVLDEG